MQSLGRSSQPPQDVLTRGADAAPWRVEPIAPARGIALALALGGLGWAAIGGLVLLVRMLIAS